MTLQKKHFYDPFDIRDISDISLMLAIYFGWFYIWSGMVTLLLNWNNVKQRQEIKIKQNYKVL